MGWVRQLVKYTETHPIYIPDAASSAVQVLEDGSIQKTVFPSLKPTRREDALLLQQWLADMMAQLTRNAPEVSSDQVRHVVCSVTTPGIMPATSLDEIRHNACSLQLIIQLKDAVSNSRSL